MQLGKEGSRSREPVSAGVAVVGLSTCRCCAPVPLSGDSYGRTLNSRGGSPPGRTTSAPVKQQGACIPTLSPARGKYSDPPDHCYTCTNRQTHTTLLPSF